MKKVLPPQAPSQVQRVVGHKIKALTDRGVPAAEASAHANNMVGKAPPSFPARAKPVPAPGAKSKF